MNTVDVKNYKHSIETGDGDSELSTRGEIRKQLLLGDVNRNKYPMLFNYDMYVRKVEEYFLITYLTGRPPRAPHYLRIPEIAEALRNSLPHVNISALIQYVDIIKKNKGRYSYEIDRFHDELYKFVQEANSYF